MKSRAEIVYGMRFHGDPDRPGPYPHEKGGKSEKKKGVTVLEKINSHPHVKSISDERSEGHGFWIYLKDGHISPSTDTSTIHEDTISKALAQLKYTVKGNSKDIEKDIKDSDWDFLETLK